MRLLAFVVVIVVVVVSAMLKGGGGTHSFEVALTWGLEVLAILMGWGMCVCVCAKSFHSLKGEGGAQSCILAWGWGRKNKFRIRDFPIL